MSRPLCESCHMAISRACAQPGCPHNEETHAPSCAIELGYNACTCPPSCVNCGKVAAAHRYSGWHTGNCHGFVPPSHLSTSGASSIVSMPDPYRTRDAQIIDLDAIRASYGGAGWPVDDLVAEVEKLQRLLVAMDAEHGRLVEQVENLTTTERHDHEYIVRIESTLTDTQTERDMAQAEVERLRAWSLTLISEINAAKAGALLASACVRAVQPVDPDEDVSDAYFAGWHDGTREQAAATIRALETLTTTTEAS